MSTKNLPPATDKDKTSNPATGETAGPAGAEQKDPFADLAHLRLGQDFAASVGVKKILTTVPVGRPDPQIFFRVHPEEEWQLQTAVLDIKADREVYLVDRSLWPELSREIIPKVIFTTMSRQQVLRLWPVKLPGEDGRLDNWNLSALEAADVAKKHWVKLTSNMALGAYEVAKALGEFPDPEWPTDLSFPDVLRIAFKGRFIETADHPVLRRLRGEI